MELLLRPWQMYGDSTGRARRSEYWIFYGVKFAVFLLLIGAYGMITSPNKPDGATKIFLGLALIAWVIVTFVPSITLMARRLHDFNLSGKWCLTSFIPYVGVLAVIAIGLIPGTKGENDKGNDPRDTIAADISAVFE